MPVVAPVIAGISAAVGSVTAAIGSSAILTGVLQVGLGLGLTLLQRTLFAPKLDQQSDTAGVRTDVTTSGGTIPQGFVLGRYMTAGHHVCPPMTYGDDNSRLVYVIEVSDVPGVRCTRVITDGAYSAFSGDQPAAPGDATVGTPLLSLRPEGTETDYGWIRFHDGNQTAADQYLVANFASYERPWSANHIGTGTAYAVMTFQFDREVFSGLPSVQFEVEGIPLYDPRKDTTAGGSGSHRYNDSTTWERTRNPVVMVYNIMRGIRLADGGVYGGEIAAEDLPFATWTAAMNACDTTIGEGGDQRAQYEAGLEVRVDDEPAQVIETLLQACSGQLAEQGGVWRIQVGAPGTSVYSFTDADIVIDQDETFDPHPGLGQVHNGVTATYVDPIRLWEPREAAPLYDTDLEAEDGGRRLVASLSLPAVFDGRQAEQLMRGYLLDGRRFRTLTLTLPPDAWPIEPLDTVTWTSARNGFDAKLFEVVSITDDPVTLLQTVTLRERDPDDYSWTADDEPSLPLADAGTFIPVAQAVAGWSVLPAVLTDGTSNRRPAIRLSWTTTAAADVQLVRWQVRLAATSDIVAASVTGIAEAQSIVSGGILPATAYEARGRYVADRPTEWTDWIAATTADVRFGSADIDAQISAAIAAAQAAADAAQEDIDALEASVLADVADLQQQIEVAEAETLALREVSIPRIVSVEDLYDEVLERINEERLNLDLLGTKVTDAGIYVEPSTGRVRIFGVAALEERVTTAEVTVDGLNAAVNLRATFAYVDDAVSNAILDPSQIPALTDVQARLTSAEIAIDAAEGDISQLTTTLTVDSELVTMTSVTSRLDSVESDIALRVEQSEFDAVETRVSAAETSLSALGDVASITSTVQATREQYEDLDEDAERTVADLINRAMEDDAVRAATASARQQLEANVDAQFVAEAAARTLLEAEIGTTRADLLAESLTRASEDEALASDITQLQADLTSATTNITGNSTAISGLTTRVTTAEGSITAQASDITTLQSSLTSVEGDTVANAGAITNLDARVTSAEGSITSQAAQIVQLQSDVADAETGITGNASAITGLTTRVTAAEGSITSQASDITQLQTDLTAAEGDISGNTTAISGLTTRMNSAEGSITAQAGQITTLESGLADAETDIVGQASAITALDTRVTSAEGVNTAQATALTSLTSRMGTAEADITSLETTRVTAAGAIAAVSSEVSAQFASLSALSVAAQSAEATASVVRARQFLGVIVEGGRASLELVAYNGASESGSAIILDADTVIATGELSAAKLKLDGQTVEVDGNGFLRVRGSGIRRNELQNEAASTLRAAYSGLASINEVGETFVGLNLGTSAPDEAWIVNFYVEALFDTEIDLNVYYRASGESSFRPVEIASLVQNFNSDFRAIQWGAIVGGGAEDTYLQLYAKAGSGSAQVRNGYITARALRR